MKNAKSFPFDRARRVAEAETLAARKAIADKLGFEPKPRGRPPKPPAEKYQPLFIRLHPKVMAWAKRRARALGIGYQSVINQALLRLTTDS